MDSDLVFIQNWYRAQCNGTWEHGYGVKINTLDNPGWAVRINLKDTPLEKVPMEKVLRDNGSDDWLYLEKKDAEFIASGDPDKLAAILSAFREWSTSALN